MTITMTEPEASPKARKRGQRPPVVDIAAEPETTTSDDQTPPDVVPEAQTSAPPYPVFVRPTPADLRSRREGLRLSRAGLSELAKISGSRVWASETEGKEVSDEHIRALVAALDHVDEHGLPEHLKPKAPAVSAISGPTKAALLDRNAVAAKLVSDIASAKSLTQAKELAAKAYAALMGEAVSTQPGTAGDAE